MKLIDKLKTFFSPRAEVSGAANPAQWLVDWVRGGIESDSGIPVNSASILTSGPVWQAVNVIAGDLGQLPLILYRRDGERRKSKDTRHPSSKLMRRSPNSEMRVGAFKELMQARALLWGNAVAMIQRNPITGNAEALIPLPPDTTDVERDDSGQLWYLTIIDPGQPNERKLRIRPENVFHISGMTGEGIWGYSVIRLARNSVGKDLAMEKHGNRTFRNAARPSGSLEHPGRMSPEARANLRHEWQEMHGGIDNVNKIAILQEGMKFNAMSVPNDDAQWLEAIKHSPTQIGHWFNLPPHKLNSLDRATFTNIEQQQRDYLNTSLMRWLNKWQEECEEKLLTEEQKRRGSHFWRWQTGALLRGDLKTRYEAYLIGRTGQWLSANDVRDSEDMDEIDGGDEYVNPNTSANPAGAEEDNTDDKNTDDDNTDNKNTRAAHRRLLIDRCQYFLTVEKQRVERAAKRGGDFVGWLDRFYDSFPVTISSALQCSLDAAGEVGLDVIDATEFAEEYSAESKDRFLRVAGATTMADLDQAVSTTLVNWDSRASGLTERLIR